jgi:NAD(P)-dependent dehydrogenase (short-subunit alcohol dehydrogenase family)
LTTEGRERRGVRRLQDKIALVTGATRGAGRAIAMELARAGARVYVTGRTTRDSRSPMRRPETIEETAELIRAAGGVANASRVDHTSPGEVEALVERIAADTGGVIDVLVNDVWGGDHLAEWNTPFWKHDLANGLTLLRNAVESHIVTSRFVAPLMVARRSGLIVEITDGITGDYRASFYYDLAKSTVNRLALAQAHELAPYHVAAVAVSPGFLRSEAMLERFGVRESNWRDAVHEHPDFVASETPHFLGRAVAALAADPNVMARTGMALATWNLAKEYALDDLDGRRPDWGRYARETLGIDMG